MAIRMREREGGRKDERGGGREREREREVKLTVCSANCVGNSRVHPAVTMEIGQSKTNVMPVWRDVRSYVAMVTKHRDVIQGVWSA